MGIRERILLRLDKSQRIVFALFFGITLLGNVGLELYMTHTYHLHLLHLGLLFGLVQIVFNPQGIRLLFFCFFVFLLMKLFQSRYDQNYIPPHFFEQLLFEFIFYFFTLSIKTIMYVHVVLYALLAYFSFKNPFSKRLLDESEVIDDFT